MALAPSGSGGSRGPDQSEDDFIPEDEYDETGWERIAGLGEMLPEKVRNGVGKSMDLTVNGIKKVYGFSRTWCWILFTSSTILFAPVLFQNELHQMEEMQKMQQRQMLLGPNAAYSR